MTRKRVVATVHGRVQGVAFREYTRQEAERLGSFRLGKKSVRRYGKVVCEGEDTHRRRVGRLAVHRQSPCPRSTC
jgi:acylphosphatase